MAGRPKGTPYKRRSDTGVKRTKYKTNHEKRGKVGKENNPIKSFWNHHTMDQIITMSNKELDNAINIWIEDYQARHLEKNKSWWYPTTGGKTLNEVRNTRTKIDKGWHL